LWGHVVGFTHILLHSEPFRHLNSRSALSNANCSWSGSATMRGLTRGPTADIRSRRRPSS